MSKFREISGLVKISNKFDFSKFSNNFDFGQIFQHFDFGIIVEKK